jgi:molecular chaperone DnaJ
MRGVVKKLKNPYEVLGISEGASEEEIKRAYKEAVRKYHPDQYQNNPLSQLAEEKLREANEAYEYLIKNAKGSRNNRPQGNGSWNGGNDNGFFRQVRMNIDRGNIAAAEDMLENSSVRNAEWYFLKGLVFLRKGWYDEARSNMQTAVNMDPGNFEYREALNRMNISNRTYRGNAYGRGYNQGPDLCNMCATLWCLDTCCECGGCDLIDCC